MKHRTIVTSVAVTLAVLLCWQTPRSAAGQAPAALAALADTLPSDAVSSDIRGFRLGDSAYAAVSYERPETFEHTYPYGEVLDFNVPRLYTFIYRQDASGWTLLLDSYSLATDIYGSDVVGPLSAGIPTPTTAMVSLKVSPLPHGKDERGDTPDALAFELSYTSDKLMHRSPTLVLMVPSPSGFRQVYTTSFAVRGSITSIYRDPDGTTTVTAPAYINSDPLCCASGMEIVRLIWSQGRLAELARCQLANRFTNSCV